MTATQLSRLEYLDQVEFKTPAEDAELSYLLRLDSEMRQAFCALREQGMQPAWIGGEYIVANLASGKTAIVRNMLDASRLIRI